ncbi:MAG: hypothetical protein ACHQIL_08060 [Steroidobacterales bacterium]
MKTTAWLRSHLLFSAVVLFPTLCSAIYFGLIASDVYISESHFIVSSSQPSMSTGGISELLAGAGLSQGKSDSFQVRDYIMSRDALKELQDKLKVSEIYGRPEVSFFDRYPGLIYDTSFEELFRYYSKHVGVDPESSSQISILSVRAFTAEDARKINAELLDMAERLVNTLNERSRRDLVEFSEKQVNIASERAKDAAIALLNYRSHQAVFEPNKEAAMQLDVVAKINSDLITIEAERAELKKLSPDNPQIGALESASELLRKMIVTQSGKVTNPNGSLSARAPEFERLALDVEFADKNLGMTLAELVSARAQAQKQQIYLERLTQPSVQDKSMEPKRIRSIFTSFIVSLLAWAIASILIASVREHAE